MNLRNTKKYLAFLLSMVTLIMLIGCGGKKNNISTEDAVDTPSSAADEQNSQQNSPYRYLTEALTLNENSYLESNAFFDDSLYYVVSTADEEDLFYRTVRRLNLDTLNTDTFIEKLEEVDETYVKNIFFDKDGQLYVYLSQYYTASDQVNNAADYIQKYDKDGTFLTSVALTGLPDCENYGLFYFEEVCCDADGNFYIPTSDKDVYVLKTDGSYFFTVSIPGKINGLCETSNGTVLLSYLLPGNQKSAAAYIDTKTKSLGNSLENYPLTATSNVLFQGQEGKVLLNEMYRFMSYDTVDETYMILEAWTASGIDHSNIQKIYENKNGDFFVLISDYAGNTASGRKLYRMRKTDPADIPEKITLTIGVMWTNQNFNRIISSYNLSNQKYKFEVKAYQPSTQSFGSNELDAAITALNAELASGNCPDMLSLDLMYQYVDNYIDKGLFIDIQPYLTADSTVSEEDLLPNILDLYRRNDSLYAIVPTFNIFPLVGLKSVIGDDELTVDSIQKALKNYPEITDIIPNSTKSSVLNMLIGCDLRSFIDYKNATSHFDSTRFRSIMELANTSKKVDYESYSINGYSNWDRVLHHELLLTTRQILSIDDILMANGITDNDTAFHGNPSAQGETMMVMPSTPPLAITTACKYPEAAWDLISFMLTMENQCDIMNSGLPVSKNALSALIETASTPKYDWEGNELPYKSGSINGTPYEIYAIDAEQEQLIWDLVNMPVVLDLYDDNISPIILEEADHYFRGKKGLEETCNVIQSRIKLYLSENY